MATLPCIPVPRVSVPVILTPRMRMPVIKTRGCVYSVSITPKDPVVPSVLMVSMATQPSKTANVSSRIIIAKLTLCAVDVACECDVGGSMSLSCDQDGTCACFDGVGRDKCTYCQVSTKQVTRLQLFHSLSISVLIPQ